jgi:hypothetical protein
LICSFLCTALGGSPLPSDETRDVRFFAPDAPLANLLSEHCQRLLDTLNLRGEQETLLVIPDDLSGPDEIRQWRAWR